MNKLLVSFTVAFLLCVLVSSIIEGAGGLNVTQLTADINETAVVVPVTSTRGFLAADYIWIGDEKIAYTGTTALTFTGCTRGYDGTEAVAHVSGSKAFSGEAEVINTALGYNVSIVSANTGAFSILTVVWKFFTISLPRLVTWDFSFFTGNMVYIRYLFLAISTAFIITFALFVINTAMGILR